MHRPETGRCYFAGPRPRDRNRGPAAQPQTAYADQNSSPNARRAPGARRGESLPAGGANHGRDAGDVSSIEVASAVVAPLFKV